MLAYPYPFLVKVPFAGQPGNITDADILERMKPYFQLAKEDIQYFMDGWYLECHNLGYFDVEVYWLRYSFKVGENYLWFDQGAVASGEQYELELDIIKEQKLRRF